MRYDIHKGDVHLPKAVESAIARKVKKVEERLKRDPSIRKYTSLYSESDDPETEALLKALKEAKARIKKKREAQEVP